MDPRPTVLLLNFNADEREMYREGLESGGFNVIVALDAKHALSLAHAHHPDALVTRILQPRGPFDGLELTRRIKQDAELKTTRVIITSSLQEIGYAQAASAAGCDDNLFLPSVPEKVADAVWRAITHQPHHAEEEIQVERLGDL